MPFNLGPGELIFLAAAALLLFGPQKLPEIGRALGEALGSLKKAYNSASTFDEVQSSSAPTNGQPPSKAAIAAAPQLELQVQTETSPATKEQAESAASKH